MKHPALIPLTAVWFILLFAALVVVRAVLPAKKAPPQIDHRTDWFRL